MIDGDRFYVCGFIAGRTALEAEIFREFALSGGKPITTEKFAELIENVSAPVAAQHAHPSPEQVVSRYYNGH